MPYSHAWKLAVNCLSARKNEIIDFLRSITHEDVELPAFLASREKADALLTADEARCILGALGQGETDFFPWYRVDQDMLRLSKRYPDVTFSLVSWPEEVGEPPFKTVYRDGTQTGYECVISWIELTENDYRPIGY